MTLILASGSAARRKMLEDAGLVFEVRRPAIDEEETKKLLRDKGKSPAEQALLLAEEKALSVSRGSSALVIGADQMLAIGDRAFDKPCDLAEARTHLLELRGCTHELLTAVVVASGDRVLWRLVERPRLKMRWFTEAFLDSYLLRAGQNAVASVGGYQLEGLGAQLFEEIAGDFFSVLGLPLIPLLGFLRERGALLP